MQYNDNPAGRAAVTNALNYWHGVASAGYLINGMWLQPHPAGGVLYNCGGLNAGGGYGVDWVTNALFNWVCLNLPVGYQLAGGPTRRHAGACDQNGNYQWFREYYTFTKPVPGNRQLPSFPYWGIVAGNYAVVTNFHLYVGDWQVNDDYNRKVDTKKDKQPASLELDDLSKWPTPAGSTLVS